VSTALCWSRLGRVPYVAVWEAMRATTEAPGPHRLWTLEHPPVFTLGQAGRREHLRNPGATPVIACDRGGQVTWHGPGQIVAYVLLDLRQGPRAVRRLVTVLEQAVLDLLGDYGIGGERRPGAPGVYVGGRKLAALGLRVRKGRSYHGLALNLDCDLAAFRRIDPCGYPGLEVTRLRDLGVNDEFAAVEERLAGHLAAALGLRLNPSDPSLCPQTTISPLRA